MLKPRVVGGQNLELRQIRYFVAVAEEENFTAAARRLNVSQPPITRQIQQLERELDVQLFTRTQKGVELTPGGAAFLAEARQILTHTQFATERSQAAHRGEIGKLEIGYFGSAIYSFIPRAVRAFCEENSKVRVSLHPMRKKAQLEAILDRRIHLGIGRYYPHHNGILVETIAHEKILLALSSAHGLSKRKSITPRHLKAEPFIVFPRSDRPSFADEVVRILRSAGLEPNIEYEASDLTTALALTASERGVCPVPESVSQFAWSNVELRPISSVLARCPVNCIYPEHERLPIVQKFLSTLRSIKFS